MARDDGALTGWADDDMTYSSSLSSSLPSGSSTSSSGSSSSCFLLRALLRVDILMCVLVVGFKSDVIRGWKRKEREREEQKRGRAGYNNVRQGWLLGKEKGDTRAAGRPRARAILTHSLCLCARAALSACCSSVAHHRAQKLKLELGRGDRVD